MGILAEISFLVEAVADTHGTDSNTNSGLKCCIDVILEETSGSLSCTVPPATSEVITSVAIKAHQNVQSSALVPPNLLLQAMKGAVQCMQLADGTVPAASLVAMALLLCPGPAEGKKAYALMLIPHEMEEVSAAEVVEEIGPSLIAGLHAAMAAREIAWGTGAIPSLQGTPARTQAVNALLSGLLSTAAVKMDEAPLNHDTIDDLLNYLGQQLARVMPLMASKSLNKAAAGGRDSVADGAASSALQETLWEYTQNREAVAILVEEVRGPPFPNPSGHSSAVDIPSSSGSIMQAPHASGRSRGSPAAAASILSASSAAQYNMSAHSSYDEGRSGHLHVAHARGSGSTPHADYSEAGQLNRILSSELEAARSSILSSFNGANSPGGPMRSPGGGMTGGSSPHVAGHFGGHFRGASGGSAAGPSSHNAFPARTDISLLASAVPRVVEGSPGFAVKSTLPLSPGRIERMGLTVSGSLSSGVGQTSPVSAASAPQADTSQHRRPVHATQPSGALSDSHLPASGAAAAVNTHATLVDGLVSQPSASAGMSATLNAASHTMHGNPGVTSASPRQLSPGLAGAPAGLAPVATGSMSAPLQGGGMSPFMGASARHMHGAADDGDDGLNGVSLRADGGTIQVSAHDLMLSQRADPPQTSASMFRRFARNMPFMGSKYPSADVKEVQFFSVAKDNSSTSGAGAAATQGLTGRLGSAGGSLKGAAGGSMRSVTSSGRLGGKLPVVPNQAMAMAAVTRPLTIQAAFDKGAHPLTPSALTSRLPQDSAGNCMPFGPGLRPRAMSATNMHATPSTPNANVYVPPLSPPHPTAATSAQGDNERSSVRTSAVHFAPCVASAAPLSTTASQPTASAFRHSWDGGELSLPGTAAQAASVPARGVATGTPSVAESAANLEAVFSSKVSGEHSAEAVAQERPTVHKLPRSTFDDSQDDCSSLIGSSLPRPDNPDTASPLSVTHQPHPTSVSQERPATATGSSSSTSHLPYHSNTAQSSISLASAKNAAFNTQPSGSSASTPAHPLSVVSSAGAAADVRHLHNRPSAGALESPDPANHCGRPPQPSKSDLTGVAAVSAADVSQEGLPKPTARSSATDSSPDIPYTPSNTAGPDSAATDGAAWANSTAAIGEAPPASAAIPNVPSFQASMTGTHFGRVSDGSHARSSASGLSDDVCAPGRLYDRKNTFSFGTSAHAAMRAASTEADTADLLAGSCVGMRPNTAELLQFEDTTDGALSATLAQDHRTPSSPPEGLKTRDPSATSLPSMTAHQHVPATLSELSSCSARSPAVSETIPMGTGAESRTSEGGSRRTPPHAASAAAASPSSINSSAAPRRSPSFSSLPSFPQSYANAKGGAQTLSPNNCAPGTSPSSKLHEEPSQASLHRVDTSASFRTAASGSSSFLNVDHFSSLLTLPRVATHQSTPASLATSMPSAAHQQLFEVPAPPADHFFPPLNAVLPPPHSPEASHLASPEVMHDEKEEVMDRVLVDMQLQVDLAAIATDNELRTQAQLNAITKRDADPVKAVTTMAAVLGGKFFLLQGVRLILSVCLLVSSVAAFYSLLIYAKLNVALSLAIVVGMNVTLAGILLLIIIMKGPSQGGLGQLLQNNQAGAATQSLQAVLPTFQPVIKHAARALGIPEDELTPPATPPVDTAAAPSPTSRAARATQQRRNSAHPRPQTAAERSANRVARSLPSIDPATVPSEPMVHALQRSSAPGARVMFSSSTAAGHANGNGNVLARVADTGAALMNRLPAKHRDSQVAKIASSLLQEIRDFSSAQQNNGNNTQFNRGTHGAHANGGDGQNGHRGDPSGHPVGESGGFHRSPNYERARAYSGPAAQVFNLTEISSEST